MKILYMAMILMLTSCTFTITMVDSKGSTDTLDENQSANPNIAPNLSIPAKAI